MCFAFVRSLWFLSPTVPASSEGFDKFDNRGKGTSINGPVVFKVADDVSSSESKSSPPQSSLGSDLATSIASPGGSVPLQQ